jgi:uncharacterized membrane protein YbhN (UPF0104 family)
MKLDVKKLRAALPWIGAVVFALAAFSIWRTVRKFGVDEIRDALGSTAPGDVALAACFAAGSYLCLTVFDLIAVRTVAKERVAYPRVAWTSFTALSLGHTIGFSALSSGTVRYRFYQRFGLSEVEVAGVLAFTSLTVFCGLAGVAGVAALFRPGDVAELVGVPTWVSVAVGATSLALVAGYLVAVARLGERVEVAGHRVPLPSLPVALLQVGVGCLNFVLVAGTLYSLLGDAVEVSLLTFASFYAAGNALSILSHVPGGFGVLESVVLAAVPGVDALGALILFRVVYYFGPLALGLVSLVAFELWVRRSGRARPTRGG